MKRFCSKALAWMLVFVMLFSAVNTPAYAQESTVTEVMTENEEISEGVTDEINGSAWDKVTTENIFEGENFKVTYTLSSYWDTGYNANIKIENIGDSSIQNWYLEFESRNKITNIWNAEISENDESKYVIKNVGWNQDISAQNYVEFGISGEGAFDGFPENYELISTVSEIEEQDYIIEYTIDSDWGSGFTGNIKITNNTEMPIEDWVLEFDFDRNITNLWNGVIEKHEENHYVVRNVEYNSSIEAGESISFGFNGTDGTLENEPKSYLLYSYNDLNVDKEIDLTLDTDNDGVADYIEDYFGTDIKKVDTDEDGLSDYIEIYAVALGYSSITPLSIDADENGINDADEDLDSDGLTNLTEVQIGSNIMKVDTDEDELNDFEEYEIYGTNPVEKDSDFDGLMDDGEIRLETDPWNSDSNDNDILDGEEVYEQTIADKCYEESIYIDNLASPNVCVSEKGDSSKNTKCQEYNGSLKGEGYEFVGKCIEITGSKAISGEISFTLSEEYNVPTYEFDNVETNGLIICVNIDETTIPLDTTYDPITRRLSADFLNDGIYFVMNVPQWFESVGIDPNEVVRDLESTNLNESKLENFASYSSRNRMLVNNDAVDNNDVSIAGKKVSGQVDIVFVVDTTGSMGTSISNVKNNITTFIDALVDADIKPYFALVEYRDITCDGKNSTNVKMNQTNNTCWFSTARTFKEQISALSIAGGGDTPETAIYGLEFARQLNLRSSSQKFFILVTDAGYKTYNNFDIQSMDEMIELLVKDNINTSVVTSNYYKETYSNLYNTTGGIYANINGDFKTELLGIANKIIDETNDGSWIILNGLTPLIVKLEEKPVVGSKVDSDNDMLTDVAELGSVIPVRKFNAAEYMCKIGNWKYLNDVIPSNWDIYVYNYISNPQSKDTDGDGIEDYYDRKPKIVTFTESDLESDAAKVIKDNASYICNAAKAYNVAPQSVAACIFAEQSQNVDFIDAVTDWTGFYFMDTSVGIGQVRMSTAEFLENQNYVSKASANEGGWDVPIIGFVHGTERMARYKRLENNESNTIYAAAYLKYFVDIWSQEFSDIPERTDILATLYNLGHEITKPNSNPSPNTFGTYADENYDMMYILLYK